MRMPAFARHLVALGATALLAAGVSACSISSSSPAPAATSAKPSTLTIATSFAIGDLDPIENGYWGNELGYGELLMRPQINGTVAPWLLKSLVNASATSWVLTLNSGIRFQDGQPLNAAALIACMDYQLKSSDSATSSALPGAKLTATGADQVTVTTSSPVPNMPYILGDEDYFMVYDQAAYLKAKGSPAKLIAARIYTGPYVVTDVSDEVMHEVRNPNYWAGTPKLSEVTVKFITDAESRILAVEHGEADIALYPPTTAAKALTRSTGAYYVTGTAKGPTLQLFLNQHIAPFNNTAVRRAVQYGINYDQLANQVMDGLYKPATGMYSSSAPYALTTQVTDDAKAEQLLSSDGWTASSPGAVRHKDGKALAFAIDTYAAQPDTQSLAVAMQAELGPLGFDVSISQVPDIDAAQVSHTSWTSALEGDGTVSFAGDPISPLQEYYYGGSQSNTTGINNKRLNSLIKQLAVTQSATSRYSLLRQTQTIIGDNADNIFVGQRLPAIITDAAWKGYQIPAANLWVNATTAPSS